TLLAPEPQGRPSDQSGRPFRWRCASGDLTATRTGVRLQLHLPYGAVWSPEPAPTTRLRPISPLRAPVFRAWRPRCARCRRQQVARFQYRGPGKPSTSSDEREASVVLGGRLPRVRVRLPVVSP